MKVFNIEKSWKSLFQEKNWAGKLAIPFIAIFSGLVLFIPIFFISFAFDSRSYGRNGNLSNDGTAVLAFLCIMCVIIIWSLIIGYIFSWYSYEITQAAIENRESRGIWEYAFIDSFKKSLKSYLVLIIYNLIVFIPLALIFCCIAIFIPGFLTAFDSKNSSDAISIIFSSGLILFYCFAILYSIVYYFYYYLLVLPAQMRLYHTNTFGEAFKIKEILEHSKKNWTSYLTLLGIAFLHSFMAGIVMVFLTCVAIIPCLGVIIYLIGYLVIVGLSYVFQLFVFPHISGTMYRKLLIEDGKIQDGNSEFSSTDSPVIIS